KKTRVGMVEGCALVVVDYFFSRGRPGRVCNMYFFPPPPIDRSLLGFVRTTAPPDLKIRVSAIGLLQRHHGLRPSIYTDGSMARSAKFEQSRSYLFQHGISEFLKSFC